MTVTVLREQDVVREAFDVLWHNLSPELVEMIAHLTVSRARSCGIRASPTGRRAASWISGALWF